MVKNTSIFSENANRIQHILPRLQAGTVQMVKAYDFGNLERANTLAAENELLAERLILAYRAIPICMAAPKGRRIIEKNMADAIPVEIGFTEEGWFSVRIPRLLPRKERGSDDYIRGFLYPAMQRFFAGKEPIRFGDCVLVYRHVYDRTAPQRQYRDHDNIEINFVSDTIALFVMTDDAPLRCQHHYCSAAGTWERTEIYVVPEEDFPLWYLRAKEFPDEGVKLHAQTTFRAEKEVQKRG